MPRIRSRERKGCETPSPRKASVRLYSTGSLSSGPLHPLLAREAKNPTAEEVDNQGDYQQA